MATPAADTCEHTHLTLPQAAYLLLTDIASEKQVVGHIAEFLHLLHVTSACISCMPYGCIRG